MSVIYIVLPLALMIAAGAVAAFIWATKSGQFDDLDTPALRVMHDDVDDCSPRAGGNETLVGPLGTVDAGLPPANCGAHRGANGSDFRPDMSFPLKTL